MPQPNFIKIVLEDDSIQAVIYAAGLNIISKANTRHRKHFRIVFKPASAAPGLLFKFGKLTMQAPENTFQAVIKCEPVQAWFLNECKRILESEE